MLGVIVRTPTNNNLDVPQQRAKYYFGLKHICMDTMADATTTPGSGTAGGGLALDDAAKSRMHGVASLLRSYGFDYTQMQLHYYLVRYVRPETVSSSYETLSKNYNLTGEKIIEDAQLLGVGGEDLRSRMQNLVGKGFRMETILKNVFVLGIEEAVVNARLEALLKDGAKMPFIALNMFVLFLGRDHLHPDTMKGLRGEW